MRKQIIGVFVAMSAFMLATTNSCTTERPATNITANNSSRNSSTAVSVRKVTGTVLGMRPSFSEPEKAGPLTVVYQVRLDDGSEVSAASPRERGNVRSEDIGKKVELESLSEDEAKNTKVAWKIVRFVEE